MFYAAALEWKALRALFQHGNEGSKNKRAVLARHGAPDHSLSTDVPLSPFLIHSASISYMSQYVM